MNRLRILVCASSISLVSCDPTVSGAAEREHGKVGLGVGTPLSMPLGGLGVAAGLGYGSAWVEPRLTQSLSFIGMLRADYQHASVAGDSVSMMWASPGVGLRWTFGGERVRPSGYFLTSASYVRQRASGASITRIGGDAETGLSLDAALSEVVDLRLSLALASIAHSEDTGGGTPVTAARVGLAPFLGTAVSF